MGPKSIKRAPPGVTEVQYRRAMAAIQKRNVEAAQGNEGTNTNGTNISSTSSVMDAAALQALGLMPTIGCVPYFFYHPFYSWI